MLSDEQLIELWKSKSRRGNYVQFAREYEPIVRNATLEDVAQDVKFLMSFVDYLNVEDVPEGLDPTFYITCSQSGDEGIASRIKIIREKYGIVRQMKEGSDG